MRQEPEGQGPTGGRHEWKPKDTVQGQGWGQQMDTEVQEGTDRKTDRPKVSNWG